MALFANSNDLVQHADNIIVLAMGTEKRFPPLPNAPTFKELGIDMTAGIDRGVCVPPGTPEYIVRKLEDAFAQVCTGEAFVSKMEELGFVVQNMKSEEFKRYIEKKTVEIAEILKQLGEI